MPVVCKRTSRIDSPAYNCRFVASHISMRQMCYENIKGFLTHNFGYFYKVYRTRIRCEKYPGKIYGLYFYVYIVLCYLKHLINNELRCCLPAFKNIKKIMESFPFMSKDNHLLMTGLMPDFVVLPICIHDYSGVCSGKVTWVSGRLMSQLSALQLEVLYSSSTH